MKNFALRCLAACLVAVLLAIAVPVLNEAATRRGKREGIWRRMVGCVGGFLRRSFP